jgi:hypothetical protein
MEEDTEAEKSSFGGYAFCLPGNSEDVSNTVIALNEAMEHMQKYVGVSFPFTSFKLVFVDLPYSNLMTGAGIALAAYALSSSHS